MTIKLNEHIKDPYNVFTEEEAEIIYRLAGYEEIKDEDSFAVKFGTGYVYLHNDGGFRGSKRNGSIITGKKLKRLPFDIYKAIESGIIKLEKI